MSLEAANDTRPLQPLTFLAAAIRAECCDIVSRCNPLTQPMQSGLVRIIELCREIERHGEGNPCPKT